MRAIAGALRFYTNISPTRFLFPYLLACGARVIVHACCHFLHFAGRSDEQGSASEWRSAVTPGDRLAAWLLERLGAVTIIMRGMCDALLGR